MSDKKIFHLIYCHRIPKRTFLFKGKMFPICARCTGIHIGYMTFPLFMFNMVALNIWWSILLIIPTYVDALTQAFFNRESTNMMRLVTGLISGIGSMSIISIVGKFIGDQILSVFN